jgi:transposase InsO family protein
MITAIEALSQSMSVSQACAVFGFPRSSLYRSRQAKDPAAKPPRPTPARALSADECATVQALLTSEPFIDQSPYEVYATLLDEGIYHCSIRTMYRLLHQHQQVQERRNQRRHPTYTKPELLRVPLGRGPNQLWSWDITKLRGPAAWQYYYLYVILDVFSRYVVGWLLAEHKSANLAEQLIAESCAKHAIARDQLTLHADRGAAMTAKSLAHLLSDLGIDQSHARPYTPDAGTLWVPFSEAQFKTMKYRPDYPARFDSQAHAHTWARAFFPWYNQMHHHVGLGLLTPAAVHFGQAPAIIAQRQLTLAAAYARNPERFVHGAPVPPVLPTAVWINPPAASADQGADHG